MEWPIGIGLAVLAILFLLLERRWVYRRGFEDGQWRGMRKILPELHPGEICRIRFRLVLSRGIRMYPGYVVEVLDPQHPVLCTRLAFLDEKDIASSMAEVYPGRYLIMDHFWKATITTSPREQPAI